MSNFGLVACNLAGWHIYKRAFEVAAGIVPNSETLATFDGVYLKPEPDNIVDPNAVLFMLRGVKLGYVPAKLAPLVKTLLDNGYVLTPRCVDVTQTGVVYFELWMKSCTP